MKARRITLITVGGFAALLSAGLLAGAAWVAGADRDSAGYVITDDHRLRTPGHAVASSDLDVDSAFDWVLDRGPKLRITAESSEPLFVGIAPADQVERYLAGVAYDEVTRFDIDPLTLFTEAHGGSESPALPASESIWVDSVHGTGPQTLEWDGHHGLLSLVVMNADGSPGVHAEVSFGAHVPHLTWIGVGGGLGGAVLLALAAWLVYLGVRPAPRRPLQRHATPAA